jgi:Family of unknown function (DUF6153)
VSSSGVATPRRGLLHVLAVLAVLFAVFAMHSMGDHDLNAPVVSAGPSVEHTMPMAGAVEAPAQHNDHPDGHPSGHDVAGCLALLAAAVGLPVLAGAWAARAPVSAPTPGMARRDWTSARGGRGQPRRELRRLGVCRP